MPYGYTGTILRVDLSERSITTWHPDSDFYRTHLGGAGFGCYFILTEAPPGLDPLDPRNLVTIAPGVTTGAPVTGASRCSVTALSPETGGLGDSQFGGSFGPMLKRAGYDALVLTGKAETPVYLLIDGDKVRIEKARHLWGKTVLEVHEALSQELGPDRLSILQCGPAGENLVRFACLLGDLNDAAGRTGMGCVFGSKNLRAVVASGRGGLDFHDPERLKELAKAAKERLPRSGLRLLQELGTPGIVSSMSEMGNLPTRNFALTHHRKHRSLDGRFYEPSIGAGGTTCYACVVGCRKRVRAEGPYQVGDKLGGPEYETLALLGSNLDITDPVAVAKANELCNNYGLDTIAMGGLAGYLFEGLEKGLIPREEAGSADLGFGRPDALLQLIQDVTWRRGIGAVLADGFQGWIKHWGEATGACAVQVKNHGLPAHMPQIKPSQALMYAVCCLGADHMSSEHDGLLAGQGEQAKGLGIFGEGGFDSTGLDKVRMTVYSQFFYSLLDALNLCMFCWGPGNLYSYREMEDLVQASTGWECTLWELMKVGERRVNMMRLVNARQGFSKTQDRLPARLFKAQPEGPAKDKCVDKETFSMMVKLYYELMGWEQDTGNPGSAKCRELGLEQFLGEQG